jgi:hypothetical protein
MIKNDQQYETTKYQFAKLESSLAKCRESAKNLDPRLQEAIIAGIHSQMEDLKDELAEYERKMRRKWKPGILRNPVKLLKTLLRR